MRYYAYIPFASSLILISFSILIIAAIFYQITNMYWYLITLFSLPFFLLLPPSIIFSSPLALHLATAGEHSVSYVMKWRWTIDWWPQNWIQKNRIKVEWLESGNIRVRECLCVCKRERSDCLCVCVCASACVCTCMFSSTLTTVALSFSFYIMLSF